MTLVNLMHRSDEITGTYGHLQQPMDLVASSMADVRRLIRNEILLDDPLLRPLSDHICGYEGKMLRPLLLLVAGRAVGQVGERHIDLAAIVEMIHQATLIHDDVLDQADLRRKSPTASYLWGNEASVLLGDFVLSKAFNLCNRVNDQTASSAVSETAGMICRGELRQCLKRGSWEIAEEEYFEVIEAKTASLYQLSCYLGAYLSGGDDGVTGALSQYGRDIGCAFQIVDDLLDLLGQEDVAGKTLGTDLTQAKPTLPIIHCLETADAKTASKLRDLLHVCTSQGQDSRCDTTDQICELLAFTASVEYARDRARQLVAAAKVHLDIIPETAARDSLYAIADFVVERSW